MERNELAHRCEQIERAGGSVRDYLSDQGYISPWGTWFRLQKEELGRKECNITDGKGCDEMRKLTLEDKKKAVEIAIGGGNPVDFLKERGCKNPSASWYYIKQALKAADPEKYARLPSRANAAESECWKPKQVITCCVPARPSGVEVPDELPEDEEPVKPEVVMTIKSEDLTRATKLLNYDGFEVTGLKTDYGRFQVSNNGYLFFGANANDELEMPVEIWRKFAEDLPMVMQILGIA